MSSQWFHIAMTSSFSLSVSASDAGGPPPSSVKSIVLVHGAAADGSGWANAITILEAEGLNVAVIKDAAAKAQAWAQTSRSLRRAEEGK